MAWVSFLKKKSEAVDKFKVFKELVEMKLTLKSSACNYIMEVILPQMNLINSMRYTESKDNFQ
jgi:hypothetical protein